MSILELLGGLRGIEFILLETSYCIHGNKKCFGCQLRAGRLRGSVDQHLTPQRLSPPTVTLLLAVGLSQFHCLPLPPRSLQHLFALLGLAGP